MQAVILAAGRGTRMGELTSDTPKPLLTVAGKTLLEHKLAILPNEVDEVVVVVGYLGEQIRKRFGSSYAQKKMHYVVQEDPTGGTADALWKAKPYLTGRFLVMNGDNIYSGEDMARCLRYEWAVLVKKTDAIRTGSVITDTENRVTAISENMDHAGGAGYANTALYVLDMRIFDYTPVPKGSGSTELGLPQTMIQAVKDIEIQAVPTDFWIEIKAPADIEKAEILLAGMKQESAI